MVEAKGFLRRVLLLKFKAETPPDRIEELIKGYANLVNLIESLKSWHMGKDVSIDFSDEGFTHVFELTFESTEGIAEYMSHPAHLEFDKICCPHLEKGVVITYKPTAFPT